MLRKTGLALGLQGAGRDPYFYPKDDTPGCTKEACGFRDAWTELKERGAVVLGVSGDDAESHERFAAKYRLPFTLLSDPDHNVMQALRRLRRRRRSTARRRSG